MDLLTVGEAFDDIILAGLPRLPRLGEELRVPSLSHHPGGGAIITAVAAARLGLRVGTISALSASSVVALRREDVASIDLRRPSERGAVTVALSTRRDRALVTYEGVNRLLETRLLVRLRRFGPTPRHLHFALAPRQCQQWVAIVERFRRRGATTSWDFGWHEDLVRDPALPQLLATVDWVFVNEREAALYAHAPSLARARRRWRQLARGAVIKRGPRGVLVINGPLEFVKTTRKVVPVDTTGAGDSFNAGFLGGLIGGASLQEAARLGNYVGGCSVRAAGGIDGLPRHADLPAWARRLLSTP